MLDAHTLQEAPAIEWLHLLPPADSSDLVVGYEAAYPFLQLPALPLAPAESARAMHKVS